MDWKLKPLANTSFTDKQAGGLQRSHVSDSLIAC